MLKSITLVILLFVSTMSMAQESILGIDYLEITEGNKIIAEAMLEMEPALIEYYKTGEWEGSTEGDRIYALRSTATVLRQDHVSVDTYQVISQVAPDVPLIFLQLDKEKYSNLWNFGELVRLKKEGEDERKLSRALYGKEWGE